jgi:hypothetical protein
MVKVFHLMNFIQSHEKETCVCVWVYERRFASERKFEKQLGNGNFSCFHSFVLFGRIKERKSEEEN